MTTGTDMKILAVDANDERQIKRMQDKIKRIRKKKKQDERKAIDDVDALQHKIRDLKFKDSDKPLETEQEAARMNKLKSGAIRSRAVARLNVSEMEIAEVELANSALIQLTESTLKNWVDTGNDAYLLKLVRTVSRVDKSTNVGKSDIKRGENFKKGLSLDRRLSSGADLSDEDYAHFLVFCENNRIDLSKYTEHASVETVDSDEEFQPRVMPNDKEESKAFKIPLWYFHYVKKVAGISLDRPSAFDILRFKPNIAVKILMQVPQFNAMARNQHKEEAVNWNRKADKYEAAYNSLVAKAEKELKAKGIEMGPLISGIVSGNFSTEVKDRLRFLVRAKQKYRDIARIHEAAVKSRLTL